LAAVAMLASWSKNKMPRNPVALAVPTLLPTGLLVAFTGKVSAQFDISVPTATSARKVLNLFTIILLMM
jgi:hypothetical protein